MNERQGVLVRNGLLAAGALAIAVLLAVFYSTVSGAVDRATHRHAESVDNARLSSTAGALPATPRFVALTASTR